MNAAQRLAILGVTLALSFAPAAVPAPPAQESVATVAGAHVVRNGDTLGRIARQYGVSVPAIVRANALKDERVRLKVGARLTIPGTAGGRPTAGRKRPESDTERPAKGVRRAKAVATMRQPGRMPANMILSIPDFMDSLPPFAWPIEGSVSSNYGRRRMGWHRGIDIIAPAGAPVLAAAPGMVIASGVEGRYGRVVKLAHENGFISVYAHNTENIVELGQWVTAGQLIATVGRTGRATAEHLHFEIRHEGMTYNPLYLLPLPPRVVQAEEIDTGEDDHDD